MTVNMTPWLPQHATGMTTEQLLFLALGELPTRSFDITLNTVVSPPSGSVAIVYDQSRHVITVTRRDDASLDNVTKEQLN